ncbi:hypothetical protein HUJ04_001477 [Dendroctonus ponderosae]|nr:hypothetical protein HUJ04_001477 [Dendroctonus ponderosae]
MTQNTAMLPQRAAMSDHNTPLSGICVMAKKQNGSAFRTNSLGSGVRTPPSERKGKFSLGKLLRPWKWKRKRKSDKLEAVSRNIAFIH